MVLHNFFDPPDGTDENTTVRLVKSSTFSYEQAWHRYRSVINSIFLLICVVLVSQLHGEFLMKKGLVGNWFLQFQFLTQNAIAFLTHGILYMLFYTDYYPNFV